MVGRKLSGRTGESNMKSLSFYYLPSYFAFPSHRGYGATAARLTPDQKVGSANLCGLTCCTSLQNQQCTADQRLSKTIARVDKRCSRKSFAMQSARVCRLAVGVCRLAVGVCNLASLRMRGLDPHRCHLRALSSKTRALHARKNT